MTGGPPDRTRDDVPDAPPEAEAAPEPGPPDPNAPSIRADKWLWYARFFKSRTLAGKVVEGGRLRVSGVKVAKASAGVRVGDVLTFVQGRDVRVIRVLALGTRRGPASEAQTLYADLEPPAARAAMPKAPPPPGANRPKGSGRPTKRERRELDRLHGRDDEI